MEIMMEPPSRNNYEWILNRIVRLWHLWVAAVKNIEKEEQRPRTQKKVSCCLSVLVIVVAAVVGTFSEICCQGIVLSFIK